MLNFGAVWGLDVGDSALKAVKLKRMGGKIVLLDYQIIRYGELAGEAGARRENRLVEAIAALQAAGLGRDRCFVSIAPQAVFSRFISLPPVDKRRIPEIVLYEARQQIPFSLNEVVWAYESVRKDFIPGEEIEIGLFAVKREVVDAYLAEMAALRRRLYGIQVAPLALYNFVRHEVQIDQPVVVVDIGAQSTDLLIIDGNKFWLRNLPIAGNSFTSTLEKRLNIPRAEAEKLKLEVADNRQRRKILEVLRPSMRDLVAEIQRSVGYYKSLSQSVKFEEVLVTGDGFRLFGLDKFLAEQLQYKITPISQLKNIAYQGPPERVNDLGKNLTGLGVAIGLALQGLGQGRATVNLLPDDFVIQRELHAKRYSAVVAAALVWATVFCFYSKEKATLADMEGRTGAGERTLTAADAKEQEYRRYEQGQDPRIDTFKSFGRHRQYGEQVVKGISDIIPQDIRIDSGFTFSEVASGVGVEGGGPGGMSRGGPGGMPGGGTPGMPGGDSRGRMPAGPRDEPPAGPRGAAPAGPRDEPPAGPRGGMPGGARGGMPGRPGGGEPEMGMGLSEDAIALNKAGMVLTFQASCDVSLLDSELKDVLPKYLKKATVYWQKVPIVTAVVVGAVQYRYVTVTNPNGPGTVEKTELYAPVSVALRTAEETDAELERMTKEAEAARLEEEKKAAEQAAATAEGQTPTTTAPPQNRTLR